MMGLGVLLLCLPLISLALGRAGVSFGRGVLPPPAETGSV